MTTQGAPSDRAIRQNPAPINRPGAVSWIPACAGMTAGADSRGKRHARLRSPAPTAILRPMQPQPTFDTHTFVKRLTRAGMPEDQAEILSKGQADLYERLVTKEYFAFTLNHELEKLRAELKNDIDKVQANLEQVRAELKHDIEKLRAELKSGIDKVQANLEQVKAELKHELDQHKAANKQALKELEFTLKHEIETNKTELKRDIKEMEQKLTIKLGAFLVIGITVLSMLDKLF